jgi:pyrrolidone-carboxylate peptidase
MRRVLVTGFEPFGGASVNPSQASGTTVGLGPFLARGRSST